MTFFHSPKVVFFDNLFFLLNNCVESVDGTSRLQVSQRFGPIQIRPHETALWPK